MSGAPWAPHWREYLIEAWALGTFMLSACIFGVLLFHPASPVVAEIPSSTARLWLMGVAMGLTLASLVYSPWGRRSGAQMNPAFTLAFLGLGRVHPIDAVAYVIAHFLGGALGVALSAALLRGLLAHPVVHYVVTQPGALGIRWALVAEFAISALQMTLVLHVASSPRWMRYTGTFAAVALASYIALESPISGTSMNPARSVASAVVAGSWTAIWIYLLAPLLGMSAAAALYAWQARRSSRPIPCGKLAHATPCLFCEHVAREAATGPTVAPTLGNATMRA